MAKLGNIRVLFNGGFPASIANEDVLGVLGKGEDMWFDLRQVTLILKVTV